ncbi:hypothetical protein [Desulfomarina sp.]
MVVVFLLPPVFSFALITAHFFRMGSPVLILIALVIPLFLFVRRKWAARLLQVYLLVAAAEWLRTLLNFMEIYERAGMDWGRLAVILGLVTAFTLLSIMPFFSSVLKKYFHRQTIE